MAVKKKRKKTSVPSPTVASDKRWEAEQDARTLSEAAAIKKDKARLKAAKTAAKPMVDKGAAELQGLRNVANIKV